MDVEATVRAQRGASVVAVILEMFVTGTLAGPVMSYFSIHHKRDRGIFKAVVVAVVCFTLLQTTPHAIILWETAVLGNPWPLWSAPVEDVIMLLTCFPVQTFLAIRCWKATKSWLIFTILMLLMLSIAGMTLHNLVAGVTLMAALPHVPPPSFIPVASISLIISTVLDALTTAILIWYLIRNRTGFNHLDSTINRIIGIVVESAVPCLLCAILSLVLSPTKFELSIIPLGLLPGFYCHALLRALNSRAALSQGLQAHALGRVSISLQVDSPQPPETQSHHLNLPTITDSLQKLEKFSVSQGEQNGRLLDKENSSMREHATLV